MALTKYDTNGCAFEAFCDFNTKVYIAYDNVLRAAYLKKIEIHLQKYKEGKTEIRKCYNVAGLGMQAAERVYLDISSFKKGNYGFSSTQRYPTTNYKGVPCKSMFWWNLYLAEVFKNKAQFEMWNNCFAIYRWKWNGIEAEKVNVECTTITLTEDGWTTDAIFPENSYPSKEECEQANQISVIEFE